MSRRDDNQPEPVNFCSDHDATEVSDARQELMIAVAIAIIATPLVAALANWILPIVWGMK